MYIDFHIHAYADEIADRAVQKLKDTANCNVYTNGRYKAEAERVGH